MMTSNHKINKKSCVKTQTFFSENRGIVCQIRIYYLAIIAVVCLNGTLTLLLPTNNNLLQLSLICISRIIVPLPLE